MRWGVNVIFEGLDVLRHGLSSVSVRRWSRNQKIVSLSSISQDVKSISGTHL
jgi:hypothetical protein